MAPRKKKEIVIEPKMEDTIPECPVEVPNEKVVDEPEEDLKGTFNNVEPIRKPVRWIRKLD